MPRLVKFRNIINPSVLFFVAVGLLLFFGKNSWWPEFYHARFYSLTFFTSAFFIILSKIIFRSDDECKRDSLILLQSILSLALVFNALGELYLYQLYKIGIQYDKIIHFTNSFLFIIALTSFNVAWKKQPIKKALKTSILMVVAGSLLWELFEYLSDLFFHTSEFGVDGKYIIKDTILDLACDALGIIFSSYILNSPKLSKKIINEYCHWPILTDSDETK